jgi:GNAT superfamily N-acetyltransferase
VTRSLAGVLEDRERPLISGAIGRRTVAISKLVSYEEPIRRMLILIALYAIPAVVAMRPVTDPDIWWHLRTGQWIVAHGAVPTTDPFSRFGLGRPWVAYSWLFELLVYGLYRGLGLGGILLYRVVLTLAVALSVHRLVAKREPRFAVALGLVGAALLALLPLMNERPWLFTILFSALTLDVVLDLRAGRSTRAAWLLPPLFALWANLHIQFVYGLFLLALA